MDYAFVPGIGDEALEWLAGAMGKRPQTTLVALTAQTATLQTFLATLKFEIDHFGLPVADDLLLGAHGADGGYLFMAIDANTKSPANYESLQNLTTIVVPPGVGTANTNVRLGSCSLGADSMQPFLKLMKQALGNPKTLSAPRYLHAFHNPNGTDYWESMRYEFEVLGTQGGLEPLTTRDSVVGKFGDAAFKLFDTTEVPIENWEHWVPPAAQLNLKPNPNQEFDFPFNVQLTLGGIPVVLDASARWKSHHEHVTVHVDSNEIPAGDGAIRQILYEFLSNDPRFKIDHPYPIYERWGYISLIEFISGFKWNCTPDGPNKLLYVGWRYTYKLCIPVTDPGTGKWIYNHYPDSGSPIINFSESTRPQLFGIV
jgi:hypothetical protein